MEPASCPDRMLCTVLSTAEGVVPMAAASTGSTSSSAPGAPVRQAGGNGGHPVDGGKGFPQGFGSFLQLGQVAAGQVQLGAAAKGHGTLLIDLGIAVFQLAQLVPQAVHHLVGGGGAVVQKGDPGGDRSPAALRV